MSPIYLPNLTGARGWGYIQGHDKGYRKTRTAGRIGYRKTQEE